MAKEIPCAWRDHVGLPRCGKPSNAFGLCPDHHAEVIRRTGRSFFCHGGPPLSLSPCETCGEPVDGRRCAYCYEVETRLDAYLRRGGEKARKFVLSCLGAIALTWVAGCGGAPFGFPPGGGGGADAPSEVDSGAIGDPIPDAGPDVELGETSTPDAGAPDASAPLPDAAPDAPATCTKPLATTPDDVCPGETMNRVFPSTFIRGQDCQSIAGYFTTPAPCACAETFTCACLAANGVGGTCKTVDGVPWIN